MAMMMLAGMCGLGEPLTAFNDFAPGPSVPVQYSVTPPQLPQRVIQQGAILTPAGDFGSGERWFSQCADSRSPKKSATTDNELALIDTGIAQVQCRQEMYDHFPVMGYPPANLQTNLEKLTTDRAALIAKRAAEAAAKKIADDEAADKAAKDKLDVVSTGPDTGQILGMDSKTFMLLAGAAALMFVMKK